MRKIFLTAVFAVAAILFCGCEENTANNPSDSLGASTGSDSSSQIKAEEMVERALSADEWPMMDYVTDQARANALFNDKIILSDCEDYCLATNMISTLLNQILVVKPKADKADAIEAAMDEYYEYVRSDEAAFYPEQQASAAGSVKGKTANGYIYIIVHQNGTMVADKMLSE